MKSIIALYKRYMRLITKFWVNQVTMAVLGLMVSWPLSIFISESSNYSLFMALSSVITAGFFCFLVYDSANQYGLRFAVRLASPECDRSAIPPSHAGLTISLLAYVPTMLLTILYVIFWIFPVGDAQGVMTVLLYIIPVHSMYNGLYLAVSDMASWLQPVVTVLAFVPACFFGWLGFRLGLQDKGCIVREKQSRE